MRVEGFEIDAFGRLSGFAADGLGEHALVVLLGDNESGKSTFFEFLSTMLFGFHPARRDLHPYDPWSGAAPEGALTLRLTDDRAATVRRRLRSAPDGRFTSGDEEERIGNRPVPFVGGLRRSVFHGLHAVSLDEARDLSDEAWTELEERLLGGAAFPFLRPAREAAREQEEIARSLWREDRRGKPRARVLESEIKDLKARRKDAAGRGARIEELRLERATCNERMAAVQVERIGLKTRLELQHKIEGARGEVERVEKELARQGRTDDADPADALLLEHADALVEASESAAEERADQQILRQIERDEQAQAATVAEGVAAALEAAPDDAVRARLADLDEAEVRRCIEGWVRLAGQVDAAERELRYARQAHDDLEARATPRAGEPTLDELDARIAALRGLREAESRARAARAAATTRRERGIMGKSFIGAGLFLAVAGLVVGNHWTLVLGLLLALGGGVLLYLSRGGAEADDDLEAAVAQSRASLGLGDEPVDDALDRATTDRARIAARIPDPDQRARAVRELTEAGDRHRRHVEDLEAVHAAFTLLLDGIPLARARMELLDASLAEDLIRLRRSVVELDRVRGRRPEVRERQRARRARIEELGRALGRSPGDDPHTAVRVWNRELAEARTRADRRTVRAEDRPRLEAELAEATSQLESLEREFRAQVGEEASDDLAIRDRVVLEERLHALDQEREALAQRQGRLEQEEADLLARPGVDDLDGALAALQDELDDVARERDRRLLLARLLREAERRYRDRHQPDVFRRASEHLRRISRGRYIGLDVSEEDGKPHLEVREAGQAFPVAARHPLSRGTLEQIHLALRLALADQIDGSEPLPLVLDELFVNWDPSRTGEGLEVLRAVGATRQVFLMTCHPHLAERAEREAGARVVRLPSVGQA